ncbi:MULTISPECIES: hypothetical protein [unclassified Streptomyces]|uniref:hypothetical protein n=1 Tax=unclassified Streptomyces TaxID=2593676 RepID=UPI000DD94BC7|nr:MULTISPECIES: hypothetical protein [unclassified Streptomyces]QZZ30284.1 hypothetical protein A7X85_32200 [Streptomyces sp. ST1015]
MSDDEARSDIPAALRAGTGPRHAAPRKPLLTRLHVPAGKAIALAAMPTAVLMGMGFTPTLARAEDHPAASNSQQAEEYKECVAALEAEDASPSPTPSASASEDSGKEDDSDKGSGKGESKDDPAGKGDSPSSDSGSGDKSEPSPSPSASASASVPAKEDAPGASSPSPSPSAGSGSEKTDGGGLLESIGDAISDIFTGGSGSDAASGTSSPSPSPSASTGEESTDAGSGAGSAAAKKPSEASSSPKASSGDTSAKKDDEKAGEKAGEKDTEETEKADEDKASASPSPSPSAGTDADDCKVSTDAVADGRDNKLLLPEDPWILEASGLTLDGADYQGIVEVTTSSGVKKKVLKYVVSKSTKIVDLHQIVKDKNAGKTYHVQSAKGAESTITDGATTMYTESISGNLFGLLPVTFTPDNPPPLNIPWIYFSNVKVVQAGQFGGTLHIPGMRQSIT